ncbi:hypothetical protein TNCV_257291 [Trichonephila clavipes]|nr:hypothetical protein TNCV_257291 [Trichonephila clavipes]
MVCNKICILLWLCYVSVHLSHVFRMYPSNKHTTTTTQKLPEIGQVTRQKFDYFDDRRISTLGFIDKSPIVGSDFSSYKGERNLLRIDVPGMRPTDATILFHG